MLGNAAIARILQKEGVEYLFCFPANGLIECCATIGIRPILARTERTLINMTDGYTRAHNAQKLGVCAVQGGPGAENGYAGVAQAASDSTPILLLTGGPPRQRRGIPYTFPVADAYRGVTKWVDEINAPERIPGMLYRAFSALRNGRRGPIVLEVPADVATGEVNDAAVEAYLGPCTYRSMAAPSDVEAVASALQQARLPVIHAGQGVLYAQATDELRALAEMLEAPVMTTMNGKSAFPENHPLALGAAGHTATAAVDAFLKKADLILGVGASFSKGGFSWPLPEADGKRTLIQLTADERDVGKEYVVDLALIGDARLVLQQVLEQLGASASRRLKNGETQREIAAEREAWLERWRPRLTSDEEPINPYRVIWELMQATDPAATIVTHDSGSPRDQLLPFYSATTPRGYIGWGKSTQLGTGYGLALGAKLARPDKLVVNLMGDTAFGMVGMDVETAVREQIGVLTIILNNGCMGGYQPYMPVSTERFHSTTFSGNYAAVAVGLGAHAERIERLDQLAPAIARGARATSEGRPAVLEVITAEDSVFSP
jgi:acetolactate synthase-1/2/3 large subunit